MNDKNIALRNPKTNTKRTFDPTVTSAQNQ